MKNVKIGQYLTKIGEKFCGLLFWATLYVSVRCVVSGVFRMCERVYQGVWGQRSPSEVQWQTEVWGLGVVNTDTEFYCTLAAE